MPTFTSLLLELAPKYGDPRSVRGDHVHGWFLQRLEQIAPDISGQLHSNTRHKPIALWAGPRFGLGPHGVTRDTTDDRYWLRISTLNGELGRLVDEMIAARGPIVLGPAEFMLSGPIRDAGDHPWARSETSALLLQRWWEGPEPRGRVRLRFISPAAFGRGRDDKSVQLFPLGELVFRSLAEIWNDNAEPIDEGLTDYLLAVVREERHELKTVPPVSFGRYQLKGFVGTCEYSVPATESADVKRLLHLLADFAFFSGVGLKRAMGMGQVLGEDASPVPRGVYQQI